jgi:hypothetical protein
MRRGELSRSQADEIAGAAAAKPHAERSLLSTAAGSSLSELRERCARTRAAADPDRNATDRHIHTERRLRRVPWSDGPVTELANLDPLCGHYHLLKTHHGWALIAGVGKRPIVPPGDPRHPANQAADPAGGDSRPREGPDPAGEAYADTQSDGTRSRPDPPHGEASLFGDAA